MSVLDITLTWAELRLAADVAVMRQVQNLHLNRQDRYGCSKDDGWTPHIEGACGEMAVAKATGRYWSGSLGNLRADDVGEIQVRTTSRPENRLIIHEADQDEKYFVLVTGRAPQFRIVGWIMARDAKREEWWQDPAGGRAAYFVPQSALRPISELTIGNAQRAEPLFLNARSV